MSNQYYDNDDLELEVGNNVYTVSVHAKGTYSYSPATRWEPEDSSFEQLEKEIRILKMDSYINTNGFEGGNND